MMNAETFVITDFEPFLAYEGKMDFSMNKLVKIPGVMILLCHKGVGQLMLNFKEYTLAENSQLIILTSSTVMMLHASADFTISFALFPPSIFIELGSQIDHTLIKYVKMNPLYTLAPDRAEVVRHMIDSMLDIYRDKDNRYRERIARNLMLNFFLNLYDKLANYLPQDINVVSSRQEELFRRFIGLLQTHTSQEREVKFYAEKLFITPRYLSLISHQITGNTAKELIDKHVIVEIKILLQSTNLSVKQIVEKMHFPDSSFLGKFFKKHTGMSPSRFRKIEFSTEERDFMK